jgi:hypothetical protein
MNSYQVIRPFPGGEVGMILTDADFATLERAKQLADRRFIKPLASTVGTQPTVATLNSATIRQLGALLPTVVDACVIQAALSNETREAAIKALNKRLSEMETPDEHIN